MTQPNASEPLIDTSCSCASCAGRTAEMYDLGGRCTNCGATFTVRSRKGDKPPLAIECPDCRVSGYSWRAALASQPEPLDAAWNTDMTEVERDQLAEALRREDYMNWPADQLADRLAGHVRAIAAARLTEEPR